MIRLITSTATRKAGVFLGPTGFNSPTISLSEHAKALHHASIHIAAIIGFRSTGNGRNTLKTSSVGGTLFLFPRTVA